MYDSYIIYDFNYIWFISYKLSLTLILQIVNKHKYWMYRRRYIKNSARNKVQNYINSNDNDDGDDDDTKFSQDYTQSLC